MTERQRRFADEYITDLNVTRAYKAAYPAVKKDETAKSAGHRLLTNVAVRRYVDERLQEIQSHKIAEAAEVLEYLSSVVRGKSLSSTVVIEGQGEGVSEAREMIVRPGEKDKLKAAELLAKYHQLLVPRVQIEAQKSGGLIVLAEATNGEP